MSAKATSGTVPSRVAMKRTLLTVALALLAAAPAQAGDVTMVARDIPLGSRTLQSSRPPIRFNMLGLHWRGPGSVAFRTRSLAGRWSAWRDADADTGPDPGSPENHAAGWRDGNLDWTGPADRVQFRVEGKVARLRAYYVWSRPTTPVLRKLSLAGSPSIVPRSAWKADEKITRGETLYAPVLKLAIVHHTAGTNAYTPAQAGAIVRGIEVYHVKANGWNDIGYNFLVDRYGTVYEGRAGGVDKNVIGAHALGFNSGTVGIALIGNGATATPTAAQQDALVRLLAWRLDIAHIDPLSQVVFTSGGNSKFRAGKVVTLRAMSGHRDTGPSECPGGRAYALLPALTERVARTGLPKLYSVAASGTVGGRIRFQGRLSSALPWTVTVANARGTVVASGKGRSSVVDWTWNSAGVGKGRYAWTIDAGPTVLPGTGSLGAPLKVSIPAKPTPVPVPAPAPLPVPAPVVTPRPQPVPGGVSDLLSGLTVTPGTLTPAADGSGGLAAVGFVLTAPALVTATVSTTSTGAPPLMTLLSAGVSAGQSSFQWDLGTLKEGRYRLSVVARPTGAGAVTRTADFVVARTLGGFTASPSVFSPNGDGVADTVGLAFSLSQSAPVQVAIQRNGVVVATVWSGQASPAQQAVAWDGTSNGVRLADGEYVAVVTGSTTLGAVSLLVTVVIDTTPPVLTLLDGPSLRFESSEAASVAIVVNGQALVVDVPRGVSAIPWTGGPVTSLSAQPRDAAGNVGAAVSWP